MVEHLKKTPVKHRNVVETEFNLTWYISETILNEYRKNGQQSPKDALTEIFVRKTE